MSAFTSSITRSWSGVSSCGKASSSSACHGVSGPNACPGTDIRTVYRRTSSPAMSRTARLTFAVALVQSEPPIRMIRGDSPPM